MLFMVIYLIISLYFDFCMDFPYVLHRQRYEDFFDSFAL